MKNVGYSTDGYVTSFDTVKANTVTGSEIQNSDKLKLLIELFGSKDFDVPRKESKIISIKVSDHNGYAPGINFITGDGVTFGDSIEKVEKLYGETRKKIELGDGGFEVATSFKNKMKEQGYLDQEQFSSIHDGLQFLADKSGKIYCIFMTYYTES